ncbi:MAG: glycosyltransferase family 2 protein [Flavipsychrobacter sp.]
MLTIILPCYNPPEGWVNNVVQNYNKIVATIPEDVEVIVVNDGSTQPISETSIQKLSSEIVNFQFIDNKSNNGKGYAIRCGVPFAKGELIIYTDIDFPYNLDSIIAVYQELLNGKSDIVAGVKSTEYYNNVPYTRKVISKSLRFLTKSLLSLPISDTQCGLKGFKKPVKHVFLQTTINRYLFDIEFLRNAYKKKYKITPVAVELNSNVVFRKMNYKILFPEMFNFIKLLFKK